MRGNRMQVQAEKVLSKWRREGLFTPDALSEYEVLSVFGPATALHHHLLNLTVIGVLLPESFVQSFIISPVQRVLAKAKAKADAASQTQSSAVKDAQPEEQPIQAPELSPDTYDPFQTSLDDPSLEEPPIPDDINPPDDIDLPGPPPLVCSGPCDLLPPLQVSQARRQHYRAMNGPLCCLSLRYIGACSK